MKFLKNLMLITFFITSPVCMAANQEEFMETPCPKATVDVTKPEPSLKHATENKRPDDLLLAGCLLRRYEELNLYISLQKYHDEELSRQISTVSSLQQIASGILHDDSKAPLNTDQRQASIDRFNALYAAVSELFDGEEPVDKEPYDFTFKIGPASTDTITKSYLIKLSIDTEEAAKYALHMLTQKCTELPFRKDHAPDMSEITDKLKNIQNAADLLDVDLKEDQFSSPVPHIENEDLSRQKKQLNEEIDAIKELWKGLGSLYCKDNPENVKKCNDAYQKVITFLPEIASILPNIEAIHAMATDDSDVFYTKRKRNQDVSTILDEERKKRLSQLCDLGTQQDHLDFKSFHNGAFSLTSRSDAIKTAYLLRKMMDRLYMATSNFVSDAQRSLLARQFEGLARLITEQSPSKIL